MSGEKSSLVESFSSLSSDQVVSALAGITPPAATPPAATTTPESKPADAAAPATPAAEEKKAGTPPQAEKPAEEKKDVTPADPGKKETPPADPASEKKPADEKKPDDKSGAEETPDDGKAPVLPEFNVPGDDAKKDDAVAADTNGWSELAKEIGFEIKEDKFEEFKQNLDDYYKKKFEPNLGKYNAETQALFEFLEAGGTVEQYVKPTETFDRLLSLEDKALVAADLKARGEAWTDDKVTRELQRLEEADQLDLYATHLREGLSNKKIQVQQNIVNLQKSAATRKDTYQSQTNAEHSAAIKNSLNIVSDFMGTPLGAKQKDYITAKEQRGEYANIFADPKVKAEFLLWHEFGKQAITNLKNKSYNEGVDKYKNDRHNIPPVQSAGSAGAKGSQAPADSEEAKWKALENFDASMLGKTV